MNKETFKQSFVRFFSQNIGLKVLSIVVAIVLWFIVINITDPSDKQTYKNIPVRILNKEVITEEGKTLDVLNDTNVIATVTVKAPRSVIRELGTSTDAIIATADMNNLSYDETKVPIFLTTSKFNDKIESIKGTIDSMEVSIEMRKTIQLPIRSVTSGDIESGYVVGDITQSQNQVRVSGPQSKISKISSAYVDVEVTGFKENISTSADIELYDSEGNEIGTDNLDMNITSIKVDVEILATKKVPLKFKSSGTPAEGYDVTGIIDSSYDSIAIAGTQSVIDRYDSITIPESALNVSGLSSTLNVVIDLNDYLPSRVRLADSSFNGLVDVTVYIEQIQEKSFSVFLRNIEVVNVPDGFSGTEWDEKNDYVDFVLMGLSQNLENVQLSQLDFTVDFTDYALMNEISGFKPGIYKLPLVLDLPEGVWMKEPVEVSVKLVK